MFICGKSHYFLSQHRWFSGRMLACHAGGPGSIPGRCKVFCIELAETYINSFEIDKLGMLHFAPMVYRTLSVAPNVTLKGSLKSTLKLKNDLYS